MAFRPEPFALLSLIASLCAGSASAGAQALTGALAPPAGATPFLRLHATGTQDYLCLPAPGGDGAPGWVFDRPEAALGATPGGLPELAEHALRAVPAPAGTAAPGCREQADGVREDCPSWRSPIDGSAVWAAKLAGERGGSAPDCPRAGAVRCLLLRSVRTVGIGGAPTATGVFGRTTFVQRLDTSGGMPPIGPCAVGQTEQVPYGAVYVFFRGGG